MFQKLHPIFFVLLLVTSQPLIDDLEVVYSSELTSTSIQSLRRLTPQVFLTSMGTVGGIAAIIANRSQKYRLTVD